MIIVIYYLIVSILLEAFVYAKTGISPKDIFDELGFWFYLVYLLYTPIGFLKAIIKKLIKNQN